ncbi:MAG: hypothetical protein KAJ23_00055 [Maribacter sp.]|nr:hypothetical protein [Maribacter sp.]
MKILSYTINWYCSTLCEEINLISERELSRVVKSPWSFEKELRSPLKAQ